LCVTQELKIYEHFSFYKDLASKDLANNFNGLNLFLPLRVYAVVTALNRYIILLNKHLMQR